MNFFKSTLIKNILSLGIIQGCSFLLPLILLPFLVKTLGAETYGKMIFYQVLVLYLSVIIDFGYNFSSTQEIARSQNNRDYINNVYSSTILCKIIILIIILLFSLLIFLFIKPEKEGVGIFICFIPQLIGFAITPVWLFQGLEKTNVLALCTIGCRIITTALIFLIVKNNRDVYLAALLQSSAFMLTAITSLIYIYIKDLAKFSLMDIKTLALYYKKSIPFFLSVFSVNLYTTLPALIIGLVLGNVNLAYYNIAITIRNALQGLYNPISQSLFPRINNLFIISKRQAYSLIKKSFIFTAVIFFSLAVILNLFSYFIVYNILGHHQQIAVSLVKLVTFLPVISALNNILGVQTLILHGYKKLFSIITIFFGIFNCIIIYPLLINFGVKGAVYSSYVIEIMVFITLAFIVLNKRLLKDN